MRIRRKPWARPELLSSSFYTENPPEFKGRWHSVFNNGNPIHLELGCGKGGFISQLAPLHPEINYLGMDIKSEMLGLAKRKIEQAYKQLNLPTDNIKIMWQDIERIDLTLDSCDTIDRIYINFCNPWPRKKQKKKRLTHTRQLLKYKQFLKQDGEIWFKTDNDELFAETLEYLAEAGFETPYITYDLHNSGFEPNYLTEHELMYTEEGSKIKFLIAKIKKC